MKKKDKPVPEAYEPAVNQATTTHQYTVAREAWDHINCEKRQLCVEQVKMLIMNDERLRLDRKKVQEMIRKVNTTGEPLTSQDCLGLGYFCGDEHGFPVTISQLKNRR